MGRSVFKAISYISLIFSVYLINSSCAYTEKIHRLSEQGNIKAIQKYLDNGADINQVTKRNWVSGSSSGLTPLHFAIIGGQTGTVRFLLNNGADINARSSKGKPLYLATNLAEADIVRLLLTNGATSESSDKNQESLLHLAVWSKGLSSKDIKRTHDNQRRASTIKVLLEFGLSPNIKDRNGETPLMRAIKFHNQFAIDLLQQYGADIHTIDNRGNNALFHVAKKSAADKKQLEFNIFKQLLHQGVNVRHINNSNQSLLHIHCNPDIAAILLVKKLDVNYEDNNGNSPLHYAVSCELKTIKMLIDAGANISAKNKQGITPLHIALLHKKIDQEKMDFLLDQTNTPNISDMNGSSLLHAIAQQGKTAWIVNRLVQLGADINIKDNAGCTPLHWAVHNHHERIAEALLATDADPNATNAQGQTALHIVAGNAQLSETYINLLIQAGARRDIRDNANFYPFQVAQHAYRNESAVKKLVISDTNDQPKTKNSRLLDQCQPSLFKFKRFDSGL